MAKQKTNRQTTEYTTHYRKTNPEHNELGQKPEMISVSADW